MASNKRKGGNYSTAERNSYKKGFFAGLFTARKQNSNVPKTKKNSNNTNVKVGNRKDLLDMSERYRKRGLGALLYNGKIYDTNFKGKPEELTKSFIRDLRKEYVFPGERVSDLEVADRYVKHMRIKYGSFDAVSGKFLGMIDE